jgi:hypothetical protein
MNNWQKYPETKPPDNPDQCDAWWDHYHSDKVLIFDGRNIDIGYLRQICDDDEPQWHENGRDSYYVDGVTHWRLLPGPPE